MIKFLCKDLWSLVFKKQVDNLKTNHRVSRYQTVQRCNKARADASRQGVYVLTDNAFRPFSRMSTEAGGQAIVRAQPVCCSRIFCTRPQSFDADNDASSSGSPAASSGAHWQQWASMPPSRPRRASCRPPYSRSRRFQPRPSQPLVAQDALTCRPRSWTSPDAVTGCSSREHGVYDSMAALVTRHLRRLSCLRPNAN